MTQQAASKTVADLERRGYVARTPDPADARARLGPRRVDAARRLLLDVVAELGEEPAVRGRRVRAPR